MKKLVVCGATGKQGGSVIEAMKNLKGWKLHAFSRDPDGHKASYLKNKGIKVDQADLLDLESLIKVFKGAECVFGVTQPWNISYTKCNTNSEMQQAKNIVGACKEANIRHLVLSTAAYIAEEKVDLPHVDIKMDIEAYVKSSGVPSTILQPAQFMDDIGMKFFPVKKGEIRGFVAGDTKVPYIATRDIGIFARIAFENPHENMGNKIKLVGDFVSGFELADILSKIRGEKFKYTTVPKWLIWTFSKEFYQMKNAFEDFALKTLPNQIFCEIEECKSVNHQLMSMEEYLKSEGWASREL